jgi:acetate kinase
MKILVLNPGGNSLKAQMVECRAGQRHAFEGEELLSVMIEGIGKRAELSVMRDKKKSATERIEAESFKQAAGSFFQLWGKHAGSDRLLEMSGIDAAAARVVHGGREFDKATVIDEHVVELIVEFEKLAPLHNKSSIEVLEPVRRRFPKTPVYAVFDTAFHRTMPGYASA